MRHARSLYTGIGLQVHLLTMTLSLLSLGSVWVYWYVKYKSDIKKSNTVPQIEDMSFSVLLFGKDCKNGVDPCLGARIQMCQNILKLRPQHVVLSGGGSPSEASIMKKYLRNVPSSTSIILEEHSTNTIENLAYSKEFFQQSPVILVSNCYHMRRINVLAKEFLPKFYIVQAPASNRSLQRDLLEAFYAGWLELGLWWSKKINQRDKFLLVDASHFLTNRQ